MDINSVSIGTATLLAQLMTGLEKSHVLTSIQVDDIFNESIVRQSQDGDTPANIEAASFLREVWQSVQNNRNRPAIR